MFVRSVQSATVLAAVWLSFSISQPTVAEEHQAVSYYETNNLSAALDRIAALEDEVATLRSSDGAGACSSCYGCGDDCFGLDCACCCPGIVAGFELPILEPHIGTLTANGIGTFSLTPEWDAEVATRVWLGYTTDQCTTLRFNWFQFDHSTSGFVPLIADLETDTLGTVSLDLDVDALDFEIAQRGHFCAWDVEVAGGVRYGRLESGFNAAILGLPSFGLSTDFEGAGPTVAVAARRPIGGRGLAFFGKARGSFLFGDTGINGRGAFAALNAFNVEISEHEMQVWEIQVGGDYSREVAGGAQVYLRGAYEAQVWELAPVLGILDSEVGFVGPTFAIGIVR